MQRPDDHLSSECHQIALTADSSVTCVPTFLPHCTVTPDEGRQQLPSDMAECCRCSGGEHVLRQSVLHVCTA